MLVNSAILLVLCAVFLAPSLGIQRMHKIAKRALAEKNLTDPGGCVQNCFIKQNRAIADEVPSNVSNIIASINATANGTKIRPNSTHPAVRGCEIHNIAVKCLETCPESLAKSLYLNSVLTETAQCNVSKELLKSQWDCVSNDSLVAQIKACNSKCPSVPLGLTESIGLNPNVAQVIFINYEADESIVEKDLNESCSSALCLWPCMRPIVESRCGKAVSDQSNVINKAEIESVVGTFRELKVIKETPKECQKYLKEAK